MLNTKEVMANIAVKDLAIARQFYETKLGMIPSEHECEQVLAYRCGGATLLVYQSEYAGTNQATSATWSVGTDIADLVYRLKEKGVKFERYDMPDTTHSGDVHVSGKMKVAWFKDPDGNILCLTGE